LIAAPELLASSRSQWQSVQSIRDAHWEEKRAAGKAALRDIEVTYFHTYCRARIAERHRPSCAVLDSSVVQPAAHAPTGWGHLQRTLSQAVQQTIKSVVLYIRLASAANIDSARATQPT
jgi:hypothetical protein